MPRKHGSHGGSWKVAYADFITAMMALFLVLWLSSQDQRIKEAIARSFRNPFMSVTKESTGIIPNKEYHSVKAESGKFDAASAVELNMLRRLNEDLLKALNTQEPEEEQAVRMELTSEGLRITIFDRARKPVFEPDSDRFTPYGAWVFSTLAWQIARYRTFLVELEGHTDEALQRPQAPDPWELTSGRANAARRELVKHGVQGDQIKKVAGYGTTIPVPGHAPADEVNRRVSVLLKVGDNK